MNVTDILDEIDAVLAAGEPETGYNFGDPTYPKCPRGCGRHWHGMAVTHRIQMMAFKRCLDPEYRPDTDDSEILCPAPEFVGPFMSPHIAAKRHRRDTESVGTIGEFQHLTESILQQAAEQIFSLLGLPIIEVEAARRVLGLPPRPSPNAGISASQPARPPRGGWRGMPASITLVDELQLEPHPDPVTDAVAATIRDNSRPEEQAAAAARAALDERPIRIPGARPIPREPDVPPDSMWAAVLARLRFRTTA